jgi:hypothetical protein
MRWRDIRFDKPTKDHGILLCKDKDDSGHEFLCTWDRTSGAKCWLPVSELLEPVLPGEIPDGWRAVNRMVDERAKCVKIEVWDYGMNRWVNCVSDSTKTWLNGVYYIVPVDPPAPQYRPFAGVTEFMPHTDRLWRYKDNLNVMPPAPFSDATHYGDSWEVSLISKEFVEMLDGKIVASPFGVKIE